jgi:hypothetical protein
MNLMKLQVFQVLDKVSNNEPVDFDEAWIEEAGEQFKDALRKQFVPRENNDKFRVRMSNIGRPLCQLQQEKALLEAGEARPRMPYNHVMRMVIGDSVEVISRFVMKIAGINVTSDGDKVELDVAGEKIKGESDIDIDRKVWDIKSTSPWGFTNKWMKGYSGLAEDDSFGYIGQIMGYSDAQDKEPGGWVVINKSTGEWEFVSFEGSEEDKARIRQERENTVMTLRDNLPFMRRFEPVVETYYRKPTGAVKIPNQCGFCDHKHRCWPEAKFLPQPGSKAKNPARNWYLKHPEMEVEDAD